MSEQSAIEISIGVVILDSIDEPHRSIAGDYEALFRTVLGNDGVRLHFVDGQAELLPEHDSCDGWIIPGSRRSVYEDEPWINRLSRWTTEALERGTPLGGVCFGHQLIGQAMGGTVQRSDHGWNIGAIDYDVVARPPQLEGGPDRFRLIASHQDQLIALPDGAELFATSDRCPVAGYTVGSNVLCVQGHPEFVPDLAASLYRSRIERIGLDNVTSALDSLDRPLDSLLVGRWVIDTIRSSATA